MLIHENTKQKIEKPQQVARLLRDILSCECEVDQGKEHFWVIGLNSRLVVMYVELVSLGTVDSCLVHPREVFRTAISRGVTSIIAGHNHPSGDDEPSAPDVAITRKLREAGAILDIPLNDHVIVGEKSFSSLRSMGLL